MCRTRYPVVHLLKKDTRSWSIDPIPTVAKQPHWSLTQFSSLGDQRFSHFNRESQQLRQFTCYGTVGSILRDVTISVVR